MAGTIVKTMLPQRDVRRLVELARRNERSVAAEMRLAIRAHLETAGVAPARPV